MDKLLPCPHCGGFDTLAVSGIQIGTKTTWRTICDAEDSGCGAQGGTALTKHAAAAAWNRRATNAPADPALLALARLGAMIHMEADPELDRAQFVAGTLAKVGNGVGNIPGVTLLAHALLATDGAGEVTDA